MRKNRDLTTMLLIGLRRPWLQRNPSAKKHYPALGEATISGLMVTADERTGLAKKVEPIIVGKNLENRI